MTVTGVNHVQINVPSDALAVARDFYIGFLGLREIERPAVFTRNGVWLNAGTFEVHLGSEDGIERHKTRAHVAFEVNDIAAWRSEIESRGWKITDQPKIPGFHRFHFRDPFGNNLELIQKE